MFAVFVIKTIKELLDTSKTNTKMTSEILNMLFLLWNFAKLRAMVEGCHMMNFGPLLARLSLDTNDELFMMITNCITRRSIYFVRTRNEDYAKLTNRLYSNGIEALLFRHHTRLKVILTEYSIKVLSTCSRLLLIRRKSFTGKISLMLYFILHLPLLLFEHGQRYPVTMSQILDKALKAIAEVIVYYGSPFVKRYKQMGSKQQSNLSKYKDHEIILELGEVGTILLKTNINVSLECRFWLREFTDALHEVCVWRFQTLGTMYTGKSNDWFSRYHTTLLNGLFELNYANNKKYMYNVVK